MEWSALGTLTMKAAANVNDHAQFTVGNNGVFTIATHDNDTTVGHLTIDADGDYTDNDASCADSGNDTVQIYQAFSEQITVYENVEVMIDETFELDLSNYQANALVYYLKAKISEDMKDIEGREYFIRLFYKQLEKFSSRGKAGPNIMQGHWSFR